MGNGSVFFARAMLRLPLAAFGLAAAGWGAWMFPGFVRGTTIERVATRIIMMEPYRLDVLKSVLDFNQIVVPAGLCRPSNARAAAIIQIKIFEASKILIWMMAAARALDGRHSPAGTTI